MNTLSHQYLSGDYKRHASVFLGKKLSFFEGFSSIFMVHDTSRENISFGGNENNEIDREAIYGDWSTIGNDLEKETKKEILQYEQAQTNS